MTYHQSIRPPSYYQRTKTRTIRRIPHGYYSQAILPPMHFSHRRKQRAASRMAVIEAHNNAELAMAS